MSKLLSECLTQAADLIEKEDWVQRAFRVAGVKGGIQYCMIGACREVCPAEPELGIAGNDYWFAGALGFPSPDEAFTYNDRRNRTKAHVLAHMRKCAKIQARKEARAT